MQFYFKTREAARKATFGKFKDNGQQSPKGKRFARELVTTKSTKNESKFDAN